MPAKTLHTVLRHNHFWMLETNGCLVALLPGPCPTFFPSFLDFTVTELGVSSCVLLRPHVVSMELGTICGNRRVSECFRLYVPPKSIENGEAMVLVEYTPSSFALFC